MNSGTNEEADAEGHVLCSLATRQPLEAMWKKLKTGLRQFKEAKPGERFLNVHERWKEHSRGPVATVVIIACGSVLIAGGFLLGLIPGVPGIVLGLLGVALIATRFRRMAAWLDRSELKMRRVWRKFRNAVAHP